MSTPAKSGSKWLAVHKRHAIYHRDDFQCVYCCAVGHLTIDHVKDCKAHGRVNEATNLVTCCLSCNSSKKDTSRRAWFKVLRSRGIDTNAVRRRIARQTCLQLDLEKGRALLFLFKGNGQRSLRRKTPVARRSESSGDVDPIDPIDVMVNTVRRTWVPEAGGEYDRIGGRGDTLCVLVQNGRMKWIDASCRAASFVDAGFQLGRNDD